MIDWTQVTALRDQIGANEMDEVIALFIEEVEEVTERLRRSRATSNLEHDLHFLKSCALNLGFSDFSALCQTGERMARQGQADQVDIPQMLHSYSKSKACFLAQKDSVLAA
ncbi:MULTISPECIES: Hpt domain-containing protein [Roseobacteraceae]|jgi:HPt (histidine-containing phosphotransfer) domain-containing protein|uniref:Hpt domain protein n=1 Tax=Pseudosulfitobacter pseudonitzschiae TaxID=1402135 RepID=A0A221K4R3_9RHOB|nr:MULTISPECIES: Hpt domain-containing protein [Roseobacteraceae]ASM73945.1 Hpt domain protein [Pseudosulfitobacter pseudonitzschiae]